MRINEFKSFALETLCERGANLSRTFTFKLKGWEYEIKAVRYSYTLRVNGNEVLKGCDLQTIFKYIFDSRLISYN